ncbi:O-antigen polymerase [[Clostridium] symbiosum]|uniref:O-antigen polymerase n=1 Tax=Clostridium symbiosum TaxID=1512 RepID=UPI001D06FCA5|nr:O-antigen polymerase [[Clostridium] symbiosum]MCB6607715.1 oligosaccharide repeat unit polymerase [[Clostridium] symbiosum]MCB6932576.1 oligosaccharide repeat unit polymerase [[Clostridium] symbiosum]
MIYILLFLLVVLFGIIYFFSRDIFSPSCVLCESYIISIISGIIHSKMLGWDFNISLKTFGLCLIGMVIFELAYGFTYYIQKKTLIKNNIETRRFALHSIDISRTKIGILICIQIIVLILYIYYFVKNIGGLSIATITDTMMSYRSSYYFEDNANSNTLIPSFVTQMTKISRVISYFCIYIFILNKLNSDDKKTRNRLLLIPCLIYIPIVLLSGGRYYIIMFFISTFIIWVILNKVLNNKQVLLKNFIKIVASILFVLLFFSVTRTLVGRTSTTGILEYITGYLGRNVKMLDMYINDPITQSNIWGQETFYSLNRILYKLGILKEKYTIYLEFRYLNGISMGNTYTAFRCMYNDFGMIGVIILQTIEGIVFSLIYSFITLKKINTYSILVLLYSMLIATLFMHSYSESFYNEVISLSYIIFITGFYALGYYLRIYLKDSGIISIRRKI